MSKLGFDEAFAPLMLAQQRARLVAHAMSHQLQEQLQAGDVGAADADAAGQRLQHDAAQLAVAVSCPGADPAAIARGQSATRAAMVLSDLLARADARAGELAKAYDRARIAGEQ